jgi:hypothetical protein
MGLSWQQVQPRVYPFGILVGSKHDGITIIRFVCGEGSSIPWVWPLDTPPHESVWDQLGITMVTLQIKNHQPCKKPQT